MGKANPFYRFNSIQENGGFQPLLNVKSVLLDSFFNEFSDGYYVGQTVYDAIRQIKAVLDPYNGTYNNAGFVLNYPNPWPTITGVQVLTFTVYNPQTFAVNPAQFVEIILTLNNGNVTASEFNFDEGVIDPPYNYDPQLFEQERLVMRALEIRNQTGASFLPLTFNLENGVAISGLARCRDWEFSELKGYAVPTFQEYPFAPEKVFSYSTLNPGESYIISIMERLINFSFADGVDITALILELSNITIPPTWGDAQINNSTDLIEFTFESTESPIAFKLVGQFTYYSRWVWQRFISETGNPDGDEFIVTYSADNLPYEADLYGWYFNRWNDLEFCQFGSNCLDTDEIYPMPAKSGDLFRFNTTNPFSNLFQVESCDVGLVDKDGVFVGYVGAATLPECFFNTTYLVTISGSSFGPLLAGIISNSADTIFDGVDSVGLVLNTITIPFADTDTGNITDYAQSIIDYINSLGGYSATFEIATNLVFSITIEDPFTRVYQINGDGFIEQYTTGEPNGKCFCATQMQASVTIPVLPAGCYAFILYQQTDYSIEVFSVSNPIQLNNADCYSTILEFTSGSDSIAQGMEYFNNWSQRVRMGINGGGYKPVIDESQYRQSNGIFVRPSNKTDLSLDLHTDYIDTPTQLAVTDATRHPTLIWNSINIFVDGDIEVATTQDFTTESSYESLNQMRFSAKVQGFQPDNNSCLDC